MKNSVVVFLLGLTSVSFAQQGNWAVELSSGFRSEIYESSKLYTHSGKRLSTLQIEAAVRCRLREYFAIESGLAYVEYHTNWSDYFDIPKHKDYSALQIPLRTHFSVPITRNFRFFASTGVVFQFSLKKIEYDFWTW